LFRSPKEKRLTLIKLFLGLFCVAYFLQAQDGKWKTVVEDVFDKDSAGARVSTWNGTYRVESDVNNLRHLHVNALNKESASKTFKSITGQAKFLFKISATDVSGQLPAPYLRSGSKNVIRCAVINKSYRAYDGSSAKTLLPVNADEWLEVEVNVDLINKFYSVVVNKELKAEKIKFSEDATQIDNVLFNCSVAAFSVLQFENKNEAGDQLNAEWSAKAAELRKLDLPGDSLKSGMALFVADKMDSLIASGDFDTVKSLHAEVKKFLEQPEPKYVAPPSELCPEIPKVTSNVFFNSAVTLWNKQSGNISPIVIKGYASELTKELQGMTFALCHPQSPLKANGKTFRRFLMVMDAMCEEWNQGKRLGDFMKDEEVPQSFCLVRAAFPSLEMPTLYNSWKKSIQANAMNSSNNTATFTVRAMWEKFGSIATSATS
jgi:hypothetical protein